LKREIYLKRPGIAALKTLNFTAATVILAEISVNLEKVHPFTLPRPTDILGTNPE